MSYLFASGDNDYMEATSLSDPGDVLTLFAFVRTTATGQGGICGYFGNNATAAQHLNLDTNTEVRAFSRGDTSTFTNVSVSGALSTGTWYACCMWVNGDSSRIAYRDGIASTEATSTITSPTLDRFAIGRWRDTTPVSTIDAYIAEVSIFHSALSLAQIGALSIGVDPRLVGSPAHYFPLRNDLADLVGGMVLTNSGAVQDDLHPTLVRSAARLVNGGLVR